MSKPAHTREHDAIMDIVARLARKSKLINVAILITIGMDGRPVVAGNATPEQMSNIMEQLGGSRDKIAHAEVMPVAREH